MGNKSELSNSISQLHSDIKLHLNKLKDPRLNKERGNNGIMHDQNQVDNSIFKSSLMRDSLFSTSKLSEDAESIHFELKELQSQHIELGRGFGYFLTWVNDFLNGNHQASSEGDSPVRSSPMISPRGNFRYNFRP